MFTGLALLWMHAARGSVRRRAAWVTGLGLLFALATEAGQGLLPFGRTPSLLDGFADAVGLGLGVAVFSGGGRLPLARPRPREKSRSEHQAGTAFSTVCWLFYQRVVHTISPRQPS